MTPIDLPVAAERSEIAPVTFGGMFHAIGFWLPIVHTSPATGVIKVMAGAMGTAGETVWPEDFDVAEILFTVLSPASVSAPVPAGEIAVTVALVDDELLFKVVPTGAF